jgi:hypothetical protein
VGRRGSGEAGAWARSVARAIEQLIEDKGLLKQDVAESADMGLSYFYARMRGELSFTLNDVEKLARVLEVHPAVLCMLSVRDGEDPFPVADGSLTNVNRTMLAERVKTLIAAPLPDGAVFSWPMLSEAAAAVAFREQDLAELEAGTGAGPVSREWLRVLAEAWAVNESFLTHMEDQQALESTLANLELRTALRDSGTESISARMVSDASPGAIRAIASVIRSLHP